MERYQLNFLAALSSFPVGWLLVLFLHYMVFSTESHGKWQKGKLIRGSSKKFENQKRFLFRHRNSHFVNLNYIPWPTPFKTSIILYVKEKLLLETRVYYSYLMPPVFWPSCSYKKVGGEEMHCIWAKPFQYFNLISTVQ